MKIRLVEVGQFGSKKSLSSDSTQKSTSGEASAYDELLKKLKSGAHVPGLPAGTKAGRDNGHSYIYYKDPNSGEEDDDGDGITVLVFWNQPNGASQYDSDLYNKLRKQGAFGVLEAYSEYGSKMFEDATLVGATNDLEAAIKMFAKAAR